MERANSTNTDVEIPLHETAQARPDPVPRPPWTFLTNHGHVLIAVASNPNMLVQNIAETVGITQRATLHILADLEKAGYLHRRKSGRRTHYTVEEHEHFRHPSTAHQEIGALLSIFAATQPEETEKPAIQPQA